MRIPRCLLNWRHSTAKRSRETTTPLRRLDSVVNGLWLTCEEECAAIYLFVKTRGPLVCVAISVWSQEEVLLCAGVHPVGCDGSYWSSL